MTTLLDQWLDDAQEVTFSNGKAAKLRDFDVLSVITQGGEVPTVLRPVVNQMMGSGGTKQQSESDFDPQTLVGMKEVLDRVTRACWVEPKLVSVEEAAERKGIHIDMIPFSVKMEIFNWAMGGVAAQNAATNFPQESGAGVELIHES